jgi:hypothetical protein
MHASSTKDLFGLDRTFFREFEAENKKIVFINYRLKISWIWIQIRTTNFTNLEQNRLVFMVNTAPA